MGRNTTGIMTTDQALRIDLKQLFKQGYIRKGGAVAGQLCWTNGSSIGIISVCTSNEKYLVLNYSITDNATGLQQQYQKYVYIDSVPSNLGRGEVLYFICPETGIRCRILYKCYGSHVWKARTAYKNRIYYPIQAVSKNYYSNCRYFNLEKKLDEMQAGRKSYLYKGKPTKKYKRICSLQQQQEKNDFIRWGIIANKFNLMQSIEAGNG